MRFDLLRSIATRGSDRFGKGFAFSQPLRSGYCGAAMRMCKTVSDYRSDINELVQPYGLGAPRGQRHHHLWHHMSDVRSSICLCICRVVYGVGYRAKRKMAEGEQWAGYS